MELALDLSGSRRATNAGRYCQLVVEDTGDGMSEDVVERIFEIFLPSLEENLDPDGPPHTGGGPRVNR